MKKVFLLISLLFFCSSVIGQQIQNESNLDTIPYKVKHISLGGKIGIPNIAGVNFEFVIPILDNHFAPFIDYSKFNISPEDDSEVGVNYLEFGINYYFGKKGKGAYLSVGKAKLDTTMKFENISLDNLRTGTGNTQINLNTTNLKFGIKSSGKIYFRFELGYGFGNIPSKITFSAVDNLDPSYREEQTEELPNIPGIADDGILVANIGFGVSL